MNKTGTKEWAEHNVNIFKGCENDCRYCYARYNAVKRFKRCELDGWGLPRLYADWEKRCNKKYKGIVMFPSTHDITDATHTVCKIAIKKLLEAGNELLIVTKPRYKYIRELIDEIKEHKDKITFRFTIGSHNNNTLKFWEREAPSFYSRLATLRYAYMENMNTSVSIEPMLDPDNVVELYYILWPFVTDTIWIGKMNMIRQRVDMVSIYDEKIVSELEYAQRDDNIWRIYNALKFDTKVRWKDSIRKVIEGPEGETN